MADTDADNTPAPGAPKKARKPAAAEGTSDPDKATKPATKRYVAINPLEVDGKAVAEGLSLIHI